MIKKGSADLDTILRFIIMIFSPNKHAKHGDLQQAFELPLIRIYVRYVVHEVPFRVTVTVTKLYCFNMSLSPNTIFDWLPTLPTFIRRSQLLVKQLAYQSVTKWMTNDASATRHFDSDLSMDIWRPLNGRFLFLVVLATRRQGRGNHCRMEIAENVLWLG